jgi:adenylate cyclase
VPTPDPARRAIDMAVAMRAAAQDLLRSWRRRGHDIAEAKDGQILVSRRVAIAVEDSAELEEIGDLSLKGLSQAVLVYNVPQPGA